eukprot:Nk52_evm67s2118 gene=Nk52_evmTU67s2118
MSFVQHREETGVDDEESRPEIQVVGEEEEGGENSPATGEEEGDRKEIPTVHVVVNSELLDLEFPDKNVFSFKGSNDGDDDFVLEEDEKKEMERDQESGFEDAVEKDEDEDNGDYENEENEEEFSITSSSESESLKASSTGVELMAKRLSAEFNASVNEFITSDFSFGGEEQEEWGAFGDEQSNNDFDDEWGDFGEGNKEEECWGHFESEPDQNIREFDLNDILNVVKESFYVNSSVEEEGEDSSSLEESDFIQSFENLLKNCQDGSGVEEKGKRKHKSSVSRYREMTNGSLPELSLAFRFHASEVLEFLVDSLDLDCTLKYNGKIMSNSQLKQIESVKAFYLSKKFDFMQNDKYLKRKSFVEEIKDTSKPSAYLPEVANFDIQSASSGLLCLETDELLEMKDEISRRISELRNEMGAIVEQGKVVKEEHKLLQRFISSLLRVIQKMQMEKSPKYRRQNSHPKSSSGSSTQHKNNLVANDFSPNTISVIPYNPNKLSFESFERLVEVLDAIYMNLPDTQKLLSEYVQKYS